MKLFKLILNSQKGFSLIELTVAAAISVIISFGMMKSNETGQKGITKITTDIDISQWQTNTLQRYLGDPSVCATNFAGSAASSSSSSTSTGDSLVNGSGSSFFVNGDLIVGTQGSWKAVSFTRTAFVEDGPTSLNGRCNLELIAQRTKKSFGTKEKKLIIPLSCTRSDLTSSATISACTAKSTSSSSVWATQLASGSSSEYLYYPNNILIGGANQDVTAPFQISINSGEEFPGDRGQDTVNPSGVYQSFRISDRNNALILGENSALYEDSSGCFNLANGQSGDLEIGIKHCSGNYDSDKESSLYLNSSSSVSFSGSNSKSTAISSSSGSIEATRSTVISSYGTNMTGTRYSSVISSRNTEVSDGDNVVAMASKNSKISNGDYAVVLASENGEASGDYAVALGGENVKARDKGSIAAGNDVDNNGEYSYTFGSLIDNNYDNSMILGHGDSAQGDLATTATDQFLSRFSGGYKFEVGTYDTDGVYFNSNGNVGIGISTPEEKLHVAGKIKINSGLEVLSSANASGDESVAIGRGSRASGEHSFAIGDYADASGRYAMAIGSYDTSNNPAVASGNYSLAIGTATAATGASSIAISAADTGSGGDSIASGMGSIVFGHTNTATATRSIAIGRHMRSEHQDAVIIGSVSNTSGSGAVTRTSANATTTIYADTHVDVCVSSDRSSTGQCITPIRWDGAGGWTHVSDKRKKENFKQVSLEDVLAGFSQIDITTWNYIIKDDETRNIGPMAQDFFRLFSEPLGLTSTETRINTSDVSGVSLVAIKGLELRTRELKEENSRLKLQNEKLEERLEKIESLVQSLLNK